MVTLKLKPLGVRVPVELYRWLKVTAARTGTPMEQLVQRALRDLKRKGV